MPPTTVLGRGGFILLEETTTLSDNEPHPLDIVFNIEPGPPLPELVEGVDYISYPAPYLQHIGNQFAKGVKHDKDAEWFKRVSQKRSTFRHWYKGDEAKFSAECPGEGWKKGRKPGSLAHGNHNNKRAANPRAKKYRLTFTDGRDIIVYPLKSWCSEHQYNYNTLYWRIKHDKMPYEDILEVIEL